MIFIIFYLVLNFFVLKYNLHIFQQGYYMYDTHLKFVLNNKKKYILIFLMSILSILLLIYKFRILFVILPLIYVFYLVYEKEVVKPLVFTSRIKRLYATNYILLVLIYFILYKARMYQYAYIVLISISFLYTYLLDILNKPINKMINNYYVNDAKSILNKRKDLIVIAVTGSYGKTSTKNYITELLGTKYNVLKTPGNFNTLLGITRTVREHLKPTHEIFVCEVGIDRVGQMDKIIKLITPNYVVITSLGKQHLETFKTFENLKESKLTLLKGLTKDGVAFLNHDDEELKKVKTDHKVIGYGVNSDISLNKVNYSNKGMNFNVTINKEKYDFETKILGEHNLNNILGALTIANYFEVSIKQMIHGIKMLQPTPHRLELSIKNGVTILDDSYNSNPVGARGAFNTLKMFKGTRIAITPGMVELGIEEDKLNYELAKDVSECADYFILIGKNQTKSFYKGLIEKKFNKDNIFIAESFTEGYIYVGKIEGKDKVVLIENDLPDSYKKGE